MRLTKQGDYAIRAIMELSKYGADVIIKTKQIASVQEIPEVYLTKIIQLLARSGIVETVRGAGGGVRLLKNPRQLTFRHVIEAVEGPIALNRCLEEESRCNRNHTCEAHVAWERVNQSLISELEKIFFSDLVKKSD